MKNIKKFLKAIGPGFITGASDDDPTAIVTYSQSGALFGYHLLWTALFCTPFMIITQEMCGRIGLVSGKGIATLIKKYYNKYLLFGAVFLLIIANTVNIGADIGAIAATIELIVPTPFIILLALLTAIIVFLQIFLPYKTYANLLKYTALILLTYIINAFLVKQTWKEVLHFTFIPYLSLKKDYLINFMAIVGTNISPYLFFWQTSEEVEELVDKKKQRAIDAGPPNIKKEDINHMRLDTIIGMIFSNMIVFFIELASAATLKTHGITNIDNPAQAAKALQPFAGHFTFLLFIIGILGSGFLAIPVFAGSNAYVVSATFGFKQGLNKKFYQAPFFYSVIAFSTIVGIFINFLPIKPFQLLVYAAALNGVLTPFLLIIILLIANNTKIMGKRKNTPFSNIMGIILTLCMCIIGGAFFLTLEK